ncbi:hypothetical protein GJ699_02670 [Duganella sp. FT80W]|uniref:Uncharacterized protein n=1 Tax=Duganella guangzhouensis TaxID=2666084 RepID=A0A6I2KTX9_9BURK|nr:hypothetical protein [Duganella guangzhouensis]MRW88882.1 hypothetical protein [Duganella guangzhouensis]
MPEEDRKLTDADVEAIVQLLDKKVTERFYSDLGRGVMGLVWKAIVVAIVGVAAYGSLKGISK